MKHQQKVRNLLEKLLYQTTFLENNENVPEEIRTELYKIRKEYDKLTDNEDWLQEQWNIDRQEFLRDKKGV